MIFIYEEIEEIDAGNGWKRCIIRYHGGIILSWYQKDRHKLGGQYER